MNEVRIANIEDFKESGELWDSLVYKMKRPSIFCTWEWIYTWWEHFGRNYRPFILFIYENDNVAGILPLAKRNMVIEDGVMPARVLSFCGSNELYSDHIDIICSHKDADSYISVAMDFLASKCGGWDVCHLSHLADDSCLVEWFSKDTSIDKDIFEVSSAPFIPIRGSFDEYRMTSLSQHRRGVLKRARRDLYEKQKIQAYLDPVDCQNGMRELYALHKMRAESKKIKSTFGRPDLLKFHEKVAKLLNEKGWLRLYFLRNEEKPIAANYGFVFANRYFGYQMGLDPAWESKSAGNVLLYETIEKMFKDQMVEFDFLRGDGGYKGFWTKESRTLSNVNIYNKKLWSRLFKSTFCARRVIKGLVKRNWQLSRLLKKDFSDCSRMRGSGNPQE